MNNHIKLRAVFLVAIVVTGCSTNRVNQFKTFATAGSSYTDAVVTLTAEAGEVAIDADSEILLVNRDDLSNEERTSQYLQQTNALQSLLTELSDFSKHTLLLKKYFTVLSNLAEANSADLIGTESQNVLFELKKIRPGLKEATFGGNSVSVFIGSIVPISIGNFQKQHLEAELKKNATIIERELELQSAFLTALTTEIEADLKAIAKSKSSTDVAKPYIASGKLPKNWRENRRNVLSLIVYSASAGNAARASVQLKRTFVALAKNEVTASDFQDLFADINAILDLIKVADVSETTDSEG